MVKVFSAVLGYVVLCLASSVVAKDCHCLPGDSDGCWPGVDKWNALNGTVGGKLVKVVPIGAVCHDPTYDEAACTALKANWDEVETHYNSVSSLMTAYMTGQTCDPFTARETPCTIGNYTAYTVDADNVDQVKATLSFAKTNNIRFVVHNTGHDFWGRSIGAGALALRISNFKDNSVLNWNDASYTGPAFKLGAGMMGFEAEQALEPHGYVMVAGYCTSVAPAGGYTQAGGHSPLSSNFGMAADQTLEYEIVTADGQLIKASRTEHPDLFWALNGGGAGTWGVVVSMTVRVYPQATMGAAQMFIDPTSMSQDVFWAMVDKFYSLIPSFTDQGAYITYAFGPSHFGLFPFSAYNKTAAQVELMLKPFTDYLAANSIIPLFTVYNDSPTYLKHVTTNFAKSQPTKEWPSGGRLMPREVLEDPTRRASLVSVMRRIVATGALTSSTSLHPVDRTGNPTSLHPAWRDAHALVIMTWPWENNAKDKMESKVELFANELSPLLVEVAPESGSYSNEADMFMKGWRKEMYGPNWARLVAVKEKYDPQGVFWSWHTPGADNWHVDQASGRMCRRTCRQRPFKF
ncbi:FAD binding domain-containing protein [Coniochaeta sp. 2T2.1]|nr:FAD binding domain-containing protein [Coniochaeta sp. 2T2.1]